MNIFFTTYQTLISGVSADVLTIVIALISILLIQVGFILIKRLILPRFSLDHETTKREDDY